MSADTDLPMEGAPLIKPSSVENALHDPIVDACRTVFDPEIPVNIYDLGLIYTIEINPESDVNILMTLTAPGCPVAGEMPGWVVDAISAVPGVRHVDVELVWEPQWGMDMMSDEARLELGFM
ncbi:MAG: SUF system Fe-S cluster assembly protein [Pseudomonadota bacterium]